MNEASLIPEGRYKTKVFGLRTPIQSKLRHGMFILPVETITDDGVMFIVYLYGTIETIGVLLDQPLIGQSWLVQVRHRETKDKTIFLETTRIRTNVI